MKRFSGLIAIAVLTVFLTGCPPEKDARDAIAAAHGWITNAQTQWGDNCRSNPSQVKCTSTNKLIAAQHVAADSLAIYCAGPAAVGEQPYSAGGQCVPVKSAQDVLLSAVQQMNALVNDIKALLQKGS